MSTMKKTICGAATQQQGIRRHDMPKAPKRAVRTQPKASEVKQRLEADKTAAATTMDVQSGMDMVHAEKLTKAAIEKAKAETAKQFAEADQKGGPTTEGIELATLVKSVRGW
jgi:hypothetical protein